MKFTSQRRVVTYKEVSSDDEQDVVTTPIRVSKKKTKKDKDHKDNHHDIYTSATNKKKPEKKQKNESPLNASFSLPSSTDASFEETTCDWRNQYAIDY